MDRDRPRRENVLIRLIDAGKIESFESLKGAYHKVVMKTHPDAAGSERYLERFLELSRDFQEARTYLARTAPAGPVPEKENPKNHRLAFFQELRRVETLEMPYSFHPEENVPELRRAKAAAARELGCWRKEWAGLYARADCEYARIKREKPRGPYMKHALALNVRPLVHNVIGFHLTGRTLYEKQAKQNLSGIMHQLSAEKCDALRDFISILLDDMKSGAALFENANWNNRSR
jgi:hypothetical protein